MRKVIIVNQLTPSQLAALLSSNGHTTVSGIEENKVFVKEGKINATFTLYGKGTVINFSVRFSSTKVTAEKIHTWNSKKLFGITYMTKDGAALDLNLPFYDGVTKDTVLQYFEKCISTMNEWLKEVI